MNANLKRLQRAALVVLACQALTACMTTTPVWDKHFGEAVTSVKQAQVIHPDAPAGLPAIDGYDGKAAVAAMNNYDRSMTRNSGGGGSAGGAGSGLSGYGGIGMNGGGSR
ncbi:hypothetical protein R82526_01133 [Ralstonia mannitolilytica]|uniref:hypothetical protein n=1 Tax=Ralstonia mannitolilytica TaxID=105219 RepID=UPI0007AFFFE0|nr:hypothetical protein [Ralstonia mannitolilytica]ANA34085.1 lipoprotein [Ralstonia mannitolilytica]CAJ0681234.1 hypothetical protein R82526_01133 [Ralstonia mannitolilytica]CAJ0879706.1 hypothetical protein R76727_03219 [Ralstonia mannitolilytica]